MIGRHMRLSFVTAAAALVLLAAGCNKPADPASSPSATADPALQALITAAQAEGELTWYSVPAENIAKAVSDEFGKKYGIKVKYVRLTSADLAARYSAEAASGTPAADLFVGSYTPFVKDAASKGWTTPLASAGLPGFPGDYPANYLLPTDGTAVIQVQPSGLAVNTQLGAGGIKDWADLLDPKWKGKIILVDPRASAAYTPFWNLMIKEYGEDFLTKLKAQNLIVAASSAPATQQLAAGEGAIVMPGVQSIVEDLKTKGAPVAYVQPAASTGPEIVPGLSAKAAHPNAAKLFISYLMSAEGNKVLNSTPGSISPRDSAALPSKYTFNSQLTANPAAKINGLLGLA
jgi:iron(III) transport system substrate-binding protein